MARIPESEIERLKNEVSVERLIDLWVKSQYCSVKEIPFALSLSMGSE